MWTSLNLSEMIDWIYKNDKKGEFLYKRLKTTYGCTDGDDIRNELCNSTKYGCVIINEGGVTKELRDMTPEDFDMYIEEINIIDYKKEYGDREFYDVAVEAMQEFVDRFERGDVCSTYTYNKFNKILMMSKYIGVNKCLI
mgnify:FL=1|jgi:hypothetical protein